MATDHGRHLDDVSSGFLNHGHGWLPDGSDCAPNCAGCRDGWAVFVGPGIVAGMVACGSYVLEDIPATIRSLMGFANPYETGSPIDEILSGVATAVGEPTLEIARTAAWVARPNPFRTSTSIEYRLARSDHVRFTVYDLNGREVWASEEESLPPGVHAARWDGIDRAGRPVADGVYLGLLRSPELLLRRKLFLVR
ncbi:MAG: hypothetical protein EHM19_05115 [Candidatus Latescibacterota bacterium]|nr:MAG: hypothetical protein EHM19_05115 [Candidatus Latescibacterota bacterium]